MKSLRIVDGACGTKAYARALEHKATVAIDTTSPAPNVTMRIDLNGRPVEFRPPDSARDLLDLAAHIYILDEIESREAQPDGWTRGFDVVSPVGRPVDWATHEDSLVDTLAFLTGDRFRFRWMKRSNLEPIGRHRKVLAAKSDVVCLFSGGLDSLAGAVVLLGEGKKVVLVGHQAETTTSPAQRSLVKSLQEEFPDQIEFVQARISRSARRSPTFELPPKADEHHRARSFLFLSLASAVAATLEIDEIWLPENGVIALNAPTQLSRTGSLSTRTAHPRFVAGFRDFACAIRAFTGTIRNPFLFMTKPEVVKNLGALPSDVVRRSVSCSKPGRFNHLHVNHCGYCVPCVYRRTALMELGIDFAADYAKDVFRDLPDLPQKHQVDLRALARFARKIEGLKPGERDLVVVSHGFFSPELADDIGPEVATDYRPWSNMLHRWAKDILAKLRTASAPSCREILGI